VLYTPPDPTHSLWDTWLFQQGDIFHLFHLQRQRSEIGCSSIGHAITRDWLHWQTLPPVLAQGSGAGWDAGPLMTGMTFVHDGRYYLIYGAMVDRMQRIGLAVSDDLITWEKVGRAPILEPAGPWYETDPAHAINYETAWRDPYVFYHAPENCFYAFICARVAGSPDVGGGCIAVARSENLCDWSLLPPAYVSNTLTCLEVPEYFSLNGQHYLTYTTSYHFGTPYPTYDPFQATGTFYLVSETMLSGYHLPDYPNALNASLPNVTTSYVGRSIPDPAHSGQRWYYYHHVYPPQPGESLAGSLSAPKHLQASTGGKLSVRYAPDALEPFAEKNEPVIAPLSLDTQFALLHDNAPDGIFEAAVHTPYAGVCFRVGPQREGLPEGLAIWLAPTRQGDDGPLSVMLGTIHLAAGSPGLYPAFGSPAALRALDLPEADVYHLRVICRGLCADVYVDDVLHLSHTYAALPPAGGAGVFYAGAPKDGPVAWGRVRRFLE
jgi:beta-fructofuranosidase